MVTVSKALREACDVLEKSGIETPKLDARLLLEAASSLSKESLIANPDFDLSDKALSVFKVMVEQRAKREPVSRILGYRDFWKYSFKISKETLDPRADTETLIECVLKYCNKIENFDILDLGTGSGCILLSLLGEFTRSKGVGVDISEDAINTAKTNAEAIGVDDRVILINGSWNELSFTDKYDIVVSNPPYIKDSDIELLEPEVKEYDPYRALAGGNDGLDCYRDLIKLFPKILKKMSWVFLEIGYNQKGDVEDMLAKGGLTVVETARDLAGNDRCVVARWNG